MAATYSDMMNVETFTSRFILNPFYKQFGVQPVKAIYSDENGRIKQNKDIDCEINGIKIQEKSGKEMDGRILIEIYNDVFATPNDGLYGWGVISDATHHLIGYRGGSKKELYKGKVYVAKVATKGIRNICDDLIKNIEFSNILNHIKQDILKGHTTQRYRECNLTVLGKTITIGILTNSSYKKNSNVLKYAISIYVKVKDFMSFGKDFKYTLYKLDEQTNEYKLCNLQEDKSLKEV